MTKLEYVKERLTILFNEVNVSNEEYIKKRQKNFPVKIDVDLAYPMKAGELLGGIDAILDFLEDD